MPFFIVSKNHDRLNRREFSPETITGWCMVNPHHRSVTVSGDVEVVTDSGAFQEKDMLARLTPDAALDRQLKFERSTTKDGRVRFPRGFSVVVTYDMLVGVDEAMVDGKRVKRRGTEETAAVAVAETIRSAQRYHERRDEVRGAIAYSAQGATLGQYMSCVEALLPLIRPGRDWLALGGFCIIGMQPTLKPLFIAVCREVAPLLKARGIHHAHVLGVGVTDALVEAAVIFAAHGVGFSTDNSGIEQNSIMGKVWSEQHMLRWKGASPWVKVYGKESKQAADGYHPVDLAMSNTRAFAGWFGRQGRATPPIPSHVGLPTSPPRLPIPPMQGTLW